MGSEAPNPIHINVTGFKKFHGVLHNPSESLATSLQDYLKTQKVKLPNGGKLDSCTVLETAGIGGVKDLISLLDSVHTLDDSSGVKMGNWNGILDSIVSRVTSEIEENPAFQVPQPALKPRVIWVHVGVNSGANKFAIERRAVNEATFRCPDQMGWQPQKEKIVPDDGPLTFARKTSLPVDWIVETLRSQSYDVVASDDAGRFVCNYIYYQSLRHADVVTGDSCLFVHVPLFSVIDKNTQLAFLASLLEVLTSC